MKRLTLLELNEFNRDLLAKAAAELDLPHVRSLLALRETATTTDDVYDDGSLEPWVQWVSIHTGVPYAEHGVLHIGDVPDRGHPQIWERLSARGISSGVWGVLNGARRGAEHCRFFVPDPWTFSERAYPPKLDRLIGLPRFLAKNRLNVLQPRLAPLAVGVARSFIRPRHLRQGVGQLPRLLRRARRDPARAYVYFTPYEYLAVRRFVEWKRKEETAFSLLFVNMLAHAQHYYWDGETLTADSPLGYVLRYVDRVLGTVFDALEPGEELIVMNGFEQFHLAQSTVHHVYRQRDHERFLTERLGLRFDHVDAHMTNDAHLNCSNAQDLDRAAVALEAVRFDGRPMFKVQRYADAPTKLFFQVREGRPKSPDARYEVGDQSFPFWEDFESLGLHTGRHGPRGNVFSTLPHLPSELPNHALLQHVMAHFGHGDDWPSPVQ